MRTDIFELSEVDSTNDHTYTRGLFLSLAEAIASVDKHGIDLCDNALDGCEFAELQIYHWKTGVGERGRCVFERRWKYDYDREHGDRWQRIDSDGSKLPNA
jgi:hypothetical protein